MAVVAVLVALGFAALAIHAKTAAVVMFALAIVIFMGAFLEFFGGPRR